MGDVVLYDTVFKRWKTVVEDGGEIGFESTANQSALIAVDHVVILAKDSKENPMLLEYKMGEDGVRILSQWEN